MELPVAVVAALSGADEIGYMLDRLEPDDIEQAVWVGYQAQMLRHWAELVAAETCYPALAAGLTEFAAAVEDSLRDQ